MTPLTVIQRSPHESGGASTRGSHRLAQISDCPRAWFFKWVLGLSTKEDVAHRRQGTLIHLALGYYYASKMPKESQPAWFFEKSLHEALESKAQGHDEDVQMALEVLSAYIARGDDGGIVPVGIETEYFATIGEIRRAVDPVAQPGPYDDQSVSCRIDLLGYINGLLWAKDFKTQVIKGGYAHFPRWKEEGEYALKWQFYLQDHILRLRLGSAYGGIEVQRVARGVPFDTDHHPITPMHPTIWADVPRTIERQAALESALVAEVGAAVAAGADLNAWQPAGNYWSCWSYAAPCDYRPICFAATASMRKDVMTALYDRAGEVKPAVAAAKIAPPTAALAPPPMAPVVVQAAPRLQGLVAAKGMADAEDAAWEALLQTRLTVPRLHSTAQPVQPTAGWISGVRKIGG